MAPVSQITTIPAGPQAPAKAVLNDRQDSVPVSRSQVGESGEKTAPITPQQAAEMDEVSMERLVEQMRKAIAGTPAAPYSVAFKPRETGNGYIIEIRDEEGELVKQFPPEKILNLSGKMDELTGMVVDEMT